MSTYGIRPGSRGLRVKDIDRLVREFNGLEKKLGRPPTPEDIVDVARKGGSAFWEVFERQDLWNDAHAAEVARVAFARQILRSITVKLEQADGAVELVAFLPVRYTDEDEEPGAGYIKTEAVLGQPLLARQYLRHLTKDAKRIAEQAKAWGWIIKNVPAAQEFVDAAEGLADTA